MNGCVVLGGAAAHVSPSQASGKQTLIVSCGGGLVESPEAVALLKSMPLVVHIDRDLTDIITYLESDTSRPAYGGIYRYIYRYRSIDRCIYCIF